MIIIIFADKLKSHQLACLVKRENFIDKNQCMSYSWQLTVAYGLSIQ